MGYAATTLIIAIIVATLTLNSRGGSIDGALKTLGICIVVIIGSIFYLVIGGINESMTSGDKEVQYQHTIDSLNHKLDKSKDSVQRKADSIFVEYLKKQPKK